MHTGADTEIAAHYNEKGNNVYVCMLDTSKLFSLLREKNIPAILLRITTSTYVRISVRPGIA